MITNRKLVLLCISLLACLYFFRNSRSEQKLNLLSYSLISELHLKNTASQGYQDTNTISFSTNDLNLIKDTVVKFVAKVKGGQKGEEIIIQSSHPNIAEINTSLLKNNPVLNGDTVAVNLKDYGRSVFTITVKKTPKLKASIPVYIGKSEFSRFDTIFNAQISSENSILSLDPMKEDGNFLKTTHRFYLKNRHLASLHAVWDWEIKNPEGGNSKIKHLREKNTIHDTIVDVFFTIGGKYTLIVKQSSNGSIVDSLDFYINLAEGLHGDIESGYLSNFLDKRDGELYKIDTVRNFVDNSWQEFAVMTEDLRYLPYVYPIKADPTYVGFICVLGNYDSYSVDYVKQDYELENKVLYNAQALFPEQSFGGATKTSYNSTERDQINNGNRQAICPDGFHLPSKDEFNNILEYPSSVTMVSLADFQANNSKGKRLNIFQNPMVGDERLKIVNVRQTIMYSNQKTYATSSAESNGLAYAVMEAANITLRQHSSGIFTNGVSVRCIKKLN